MAEDDRCIFCREPFGPGRPSTREHVVPAALGGWLTITCVCKPCNDRLGREVDRFTTTHLLLALRREAGLEIGRAPPGTYFLLELGVDVPGLLEPDGTIRETKRVFEGEDDVTILAETAAEAEVVAERINRRRLARGQQPFVFGEVSFAESHPVRSRVDPLPWEAGRFELLLAREAAKIAVDYLAYLSGAAEALDPRLDGLRSCALAGEPTVEVRRKTFVPDGTRAIYLPRTRQLFGLTREREELPSVDELARLLPDPSAEADLPAGVAALQRLFHVLRVRREGERGVIDVVLFGLLGVGFPLPANLRVPWGASDAWDFDTRQPTAFRPTQERA